MTPNVPNRGPSWLLAACAFLLGGCASMGILQTADTLGQVD